MTAYESLSRELREWAINPDLNLGSQDEELLLADEQYLDLILNVLDTVPALDFKRNILVEALCVIVYDNTIEDNPRRDTELKSRVVVELNKRRDKLILADAWIMPYLKEVVYPQLGFVNK